jgi:hypothetical protein
MTAKLNGTVKKAIEGYAKKMANAKGNSVLEASIESRAVAYLNALVDANVISVADWSDIHNYINK